MAYRRRKRRFNGIWFPCISPTETTQLTVSASGAASWNQDLVTGDNPIGGPILMANSDLTNQGFYNQAITRQGYTIKRLVGKVHIGFQAEEVGPVVASVVAGFFVDRVDQEGIPRNESTVGGNPYDITLPQNTMKRWLWRRRWMLQNPFYDTTGASAIGFSYPFTNTEYGSVLDGPHVDCKPNAHVGLDERLFFYIQAFPVWSNLGEPTLDGHLEYLVDTRLLAKPTTSWTRGR